MLKKSVDQRQPGSVSPDVPLATGCRCSSHASREQSQGGSCAGLASCADRCSWPRAIRRVRSKQNDRNPSKRLLLADCLIQEKGITSLKFY